ncbi:iron-sulfur cluster assembly scaffold protein [Desulfotomaculum copahuensis]|uniref:Iron-sulfur cluster assembly scaffold protein n=1 Tax=Desulfotomaculum copahuensis TaxID=1838280 RepID=A0A1B7LB10_9FIRM|nr:iron-sulfur cluster assembly scaffold protein [Desulfotomaculum copahuensis]OAT79537.1 iron-sulfur cluster assembly scaffold protein [Desulfotomaculum copahuensis]
MYTDILMDHFQRPRNVGEIPGADGVGVVGDPGCGDHVKMHIKVERDFLADIKYKVFGCPAAIATTSIFTELVKGKRLEEAGEITDDDIAAALGGLSEQKIHCSNLATRAFYKAVLNYIAGGSPQNK